MSSAGYTDSPSRSTYASIIACTIMGQLGLVFAPFLLSLATQQVHIGDLEATTILSAEFAAYLIVAIASSSVRNFSAGRVATLACLAYAGGSMASAVASEPLLFTIARIVCGMAGGAVMVAANRAIASHPSFERMLAASIIGTLVFATLGLSLVGAMLDRYGASPTYAALGLVGLVAAFLSLFMRSGTRKVMLSGLNFGIAAYAMLAAFFFSRLSDAALWPYTERFGERVGIGTAQIGLTLAASVLVAVCGPLLALRVRRAGAVSLLFAGALSAKAAMPLAMTVFATAPVFTGAQFVVSFSLVLVGQLFLTHFSAIDPTGRLAGFGGTAGLAADSLGVGIAGRSFALYSYQGIAFSSGLLGVVALLVCLATLGARRNRPDVVS